MPELEQLRLRLARAMSIQEHRANDAIEHTLRAWDDALGAKDLDAQRQRFRTGFLWDGTRLTWEYPRQTGDGDQMDIVEVMEIRDGLIEHHRVDWGWASTKLSEELQRSGQLGKVEICRGNVRRSPRTGRAGEA